MADYRSVIVARLAELDLERTRLETALAVLDEVDAEDADQTTPAAGRVSLAAAICRCLRGFAGPMTPAELMNCLARNREVHRQSVYAALHRLKERGEIVKVDDNAWALPVPRAQSPASDSAPILKEFRAEVLRTKRFFYGTVAAQAQEIKIENGQIEFVFTTSQRTLAQQVENARSWLEGLAAKVAGHEMTVTAVLVSD